MAHTLHESLFRNGEAVDMSEVRRRKILVQGRTFRHSRVMLDISKPGSEQPLWLAVGINFQPISGKVRVEVDIYRSPRNGSFLSVEEIETSPEEFLNVAFHVAENFGPYSKLFGRNCQNFCIELLQAYELGNFAESIRFWTERLPFAPRRKSTQKCEWLASVRESLRKGALRSQVKIK